MPPSLCLQRYWDIELMRPFIWAGYCKQELQVLNQCWMYMQVNFVLDICTATGDWVEAHLWKQPGIKPSQYNWPLNPRPTPGEWQQWQQALQQALSLGRNQQLPVALGWWYRNQPLQYGWFYQAMVKVLYSHMATGWQQHSPVLWQLQTKVFSTNGEQESTMPDQEWLVASIVNQGNQLILTGTGQLEALPCAMTIDWLEHLTTAATSIDWHLQIQVSRSVENICMAIGAGKALSVSDGLFQQTSGTVAWIIKGTMQANRITGSMITLGKPGDHSLFCSKAAGVYRLLLTLSYLLEQDSMPRGTIEVACDGCMVLNHLQSKRI